jgi:hypothetical protein
MARHDAGEPRVIPVVIRDVDWHSARPSRNATRYRRKASRWQREGGASLPGTRLGGTSPKASRRWRRNSDRRKLLL